jgi:hypothetical protein
MIYRLPEVQSTRQNGTDPEQYSRALAFQNVKYTHAGSYRGFISLPVHNTNVPLDPIPIALQYKDSSLPARHRQVHPIERGIIFLLREAGKKKIHGNPPTTLKSRREGMEEKIKTKIKTEITGGVCAERSFLFFLSSQDN